MSAPRHVRAASRLARAVTLLAVVAPGALASCRVPRTEVVVRVATDLEYGPGRLVRSIGITVRSGGPTGELRRQQSIVLGAAAEGLRELPATFGVVPRGGDSARLFWVEVQACGADGCRDHGGAGEPVVTARAIVGFVAQQTVELELYLADACRGVQCTDEARTCRPAARQCVSAAVDARTLRRYDADASPPSPDAPDATSDASDVPLADAGDTSPLPDALADTADDGATACDVGTCASCLALHRAQPALLSGRYALLVDGAAVMADCDMDTDGGGWTLVFVAASVEYMDPDLRYTTPAMGLRRDASDVLVAYRSSALMVRGSWARFALPARWRSASPFGYPGQSEPVEVSIAGAASVTATLYYGSGHFAGTDFRCQAAWDTARYKGRLCIAGTEAPYYSAFAEGEFDHCSTSTELYNNVPCDIATRRFTIAVR